MKHRRVTKNGKRYADFNSWHNPLVHNHFRYRFGKPTSKLPNVVSTPSYEDEEGGFIFGGGEGLSSQVVIQPSSLVIRHILI